MKCGDNEQLLRPTFQIKSNKTGPDKRSANPLPTGHTRRMPWLVIRNTKKSNDDLLINIKLSIVIITPVSIRPNEKLYFLTKSL